MRTFLKWAAATLCIASCGGNVVVDTPSGGSTTTSSSTITDTTTYTTGCDTGCGGYGGFGAAGTGAFGGFGGFGGTTTFTGGGGFTSTSSSGTTTICQTCNEWLTNGGGGTCGGIAQKARVKLEACACNNPCLISCASNLCSSDPILASCTSCVESNCGSEYMTCFAN